MKLRSVVISSAFAALVAVSGCATQTPVTAEAPAETPTAAASESPDPSQSPSPENPGTSPSPSASAKPSPSPEASPSAEPSPTPTEKPSPTPSAALALFKEGDKGPEIRDIQHRLLQLDWYDGDITPNFGPLTRAAVEGFQSKRGLPVTGAVDAKTLELLKGMTRQPTHDEMHNVLKPGPALFKSGDSGDEVKALQARLRQVGWYGGDVDGKYGEKTVEGVKGFQDKRGFPTTGEIDQRTLDKLNEMTTKPTQDELNNVKPKPKEEEKAKEEGMKLDERCTTGRAICISKKDRKLAWVVDGQVKMVMDVRFGSELTPTREGAFSVGWKSENHVSSLYKTSMPYALFFSGGQAIHFSKDFAARGYNGASHGCVNVRDEAAIKALFNEAKVYDKVIVYAD